MRGTEAHSNQADPLWQYPWRIPRIVSNSFDILLYIAWLCCSEACQNVVFTLLFNNFTVCVSAAGFVYVHCFCGY